MEVNGGWTHTDIKDLNKLYRSYPEEVNKCGFHTNPILKINTEQIDMKNRLHMDYLLEQCYEALSNS